MKKKTRRIDRLHSEFEHWTGPIHHIRIEHDRSNLSVYANETIIIIVHRTEQALNFNFEFTEIIF